MAWISENRRNAVLEKPTGGYLTDNLKAHLREKYLPRYPTKRAVLLPALHLVQHTYNWIPVEAVQEIAEFLEIAPAEAMDTATFYEEFWLKPKGKFLVGICRSLACELCGEKQMLDHLRAKLGIDLNETSIDGRFTIFEMECLGACGTAPVMLVNDALHENLTAQKIDQILEKLPEDPHDYKDPTIGWDDAPH